MAASMISCRGRMESEFIIKFNSAINFVLNKKLKQDVDDTLLQKFISYLKDSVGPNGILQDIVENTQLMPLLQEKLSRTHWSLINQSFALQLVNLVFCQFGSVDTGIQVESFSRLVTSCESLIKEVLVDKSSPPSIVVAAIDCLITLQKEKVGLPADHELIELVCHSLLNKSIFVQKVTQVYLVNCLNEWCNPEHDSAKGRELTKIILNPLLTCSSQGESHSLLLGILEVVILALKEKSEFVLILKRHGNICDSLLSLMKQKDSCAEKACEVLAVYLRLCCCDQSEDTVQNVLQHLIKSNEIVLFMKFSCAILRHSAAGIPIDSPHMNILCSPLIGNLTDSLYLGKTCTDRFNTILRDKEYSKKLVINSLNMLYNLIPFMHSTTVAELMKLSNRCYAMHANCRKTLTLLVQLQHKIMHSKEVNLEDTEIILCLEILEKVFTSSAVTSFVFTQIMQVILRLLHLWASKKTNIWDAPQLAPLGEMLNRKLVDRSWEIIDSTLEFLINVLDISNSEKWICQHKLHSAVWLIVNIPDCSGYVKASAINAIQEMSLRDQLLQNFVSDENLHMDELLSILLRYMQDEKDVFVQRAAATAINNLVKIPSPELCAALHWCCSFSLDWEIKVTTLKTWDKVVQQELTSDKPAEKIIHSLYEMGFLSSLVKCLTDCEREVRLLSAQFAVHFKNRMEAKGFQPAECLFSRENSIQKKETIVHVSSSNNTIKTRNEVLDEVLSIDAREYLSTLICPSDSNVFSMKFIPTTDVSCEELLSFLWRSNLSAIIQENAIVDIYAGNFEALIDDILAAVEGSEYGKSQVIDCY